MTHEPVILLAEDSDDDILLIRTAFTKANVFNRLQIVRNGEDAISYLKGEGRFTNPVDYPLPGLLLLDLKMPGKDGFDVLRWVRQQPTLSALRIVVLTSSAEIRDVNLAYRLGANSFLVKPVDFQDFIQLSHFLKNYWLLFTKTPEISRPFPSSLRNPFAPSSRPQLQRRANRARAFSTP